MVQGFEEWEEVQLLGFHVYNTTVSHVVPAGLCTSALSLKSETSSLWYKGNGLASDSKQLAFK